MAQNQKLDDEDRRVLQVITDGGFVRGGLVLRRAGLKKPSELTDHIKHLVKLDLINASGDYTDPRQIYSSVFSPRPSKSGLIKNKLQEAF